MSNKDPKRAEAAMRLVLTGGFAKGESIAFICPFSDCGAHSQHYLGNVSQVRWRRAQNVFSREYSQRGAPIVTARCELCKRESIFVDGNLLFPRQSDAPAPTLDMPKEVLSDFEEARRILSDSPRGAAALLRLVIQKLCPILGAKEGDINKAIGELVKQQIINPHLQKALDSVRVIGNEAVHPGVMDLRDDIETVEILFRLVNLIVEKGISEPKQVAELYETLPPNKLKGIEQRDENPKPSAAKTAETKAAPMKGELPGNSS